MNNIRHTQCPLQAGIAENVNPVRVELSEEATVGVHLWPCCELF